MQHMNIVPSALIQIFIYQAIQKLSLNLLGNAGFHNSWWDETTGMRQVGPADAGPPDGRIFWGSAKE